MNVTFTLRLPNDRDDDEEPYATEQELASGAHPLSVLIGGDAYGRVTISHPGQPDFSPGDKLEPLVRSLCFEVVPALAAGKPARVDYYTYGGDFTLQPQGTQIRLEPDRDAPVTTYPASELLPALVACGERYVKLLKAAYGMQDGLDEYYGELDEEAGAARAALGPVVPA